MKRPYDSRAWRDLRKRVLERDRYQCQIRLPGCTVAATAVDHIIDWRRGGSWFDQANLRACCTGCNNRRRSQGDRSIAQAVGPSRDWFGDGS